MIQTRIAVVCINCNEPIVETYITRAEVPERLLRQTVAKKQGKFVEEQCYCRACQHMMPV